MIKGIYTVARSLHSGMKNVNVLANNLANINSTGFKRVIPFSEYLDQSGKLQIKQFTDYKQGEIIQTANPLDVAISGKGFFVVKTENGQQLSRDGRLKISEEGFLVNQNGDKILGKNGEINISDFSFNDNQSLTISKNGEIKVGNNTVGELLIAKVDDPQALTRNGGLDFDPENQGFSAAEPEDYEIAQGYLEESNVNPILEMETMIQTNSNYESAHKVMNFLDQSLQEANEIGKV